MNYDDMLFHHSYIEAENAKRRRELIHAWLMAALVAGMFGAGIIVGWLCK